MYMMQAQHICIICNVFAYDAFEVTVVCGVVAFEELEAALGSN
jgi:hypothetical protein